MDLIKLRIHSETVTISVPKCNTFAELRERSKKINKYKRFLTKLFKMKKTTQLTLNKPEQMILDEALSFYFLNNTNTHLTKEGVLKLCDIRLRIGDNIGIISGFSKKSYKDMANEMADKFIKRQITNN